MTSNDASGRHFAGRILRAAGPPRRRRGALAFLLACPVLLTASPGLAEGPFRLRLVHEAADVEAAVGGAGCVRGRLYLVRDFGSEAATRGVWIADSLEASAALPPGIHAGVARDDGETGWHIELPELGAVVRADPGAGADLAAAAILLGRRAASSAPAGSCDPALERLSDGTPILRRLRDAYASPSNERPIQMSIEP
jgi:hypothetical protein